MKALIGFLFIGLIIAGTAFAKEKQKKSEKITKDEIVDRDPANWSNTKNFSDNTVVEVLKFSGGDVQIFQIKQPNSKNCYAIVGGKTDSNQEKNTSIACAP